MSNMMRAIRANIFPLLFFAIFFAVGLSIYQDFGVAWDEPLQREIGMANINYIQGRDKDLLDTGIKYYGPTFELLLIGIEKATQPATLREAFLTRHLAIFISFFVGVIFFYLLSKNIFKKASTALLCSIALVLSPKIFDSTFYNSKDIPLLIFFIICFMLLFQYLDSKRLTSLILIAIFSALTITIRNAGILIFCLVLITIVFNYMRSEASLKRKIYLIVSNASLYLLLFISFTILLWPILWSDPVGNFLKSLQAMGHFTWMSPVLFMGNIYVGAETPPIYAIVWILISTPLFYSFLFFVGLICVLIDIKKVITDIKSIGWDFLTKERLKLYFIVSWFFTPLILVILLKSPLYDSWRHLFFIYPAFILLAFWGLEKSVVYLNQKFSRSILPSAVVYLALIISFGVTARFMIQAHPYEQLYFNRLAGSSLSEVKDKYDLDYWGLSYRQALEYIAKNDTDSVIPYVAENAPGNYTFILKPEDKKRLIPILDQSQAKYLITNYRFQKSYPAYPEFYAVEVNGAKILSVFKLK